MVPSSFYRCNSHLLIRDNFKSGGTQISVWWNPFILSSTENANDLGYQHLQSLPQEFHMMWTANNVNGLHSTMLCFEDSKRNFKKQIPSPTDLGPGSRFQVIGWTNIITQPRLHEESQVSNPSTWRYKKPPTGREEERTQTLAKEPRIHRSGKKEMLGLPLVVGRSLGFNSFSRF